MENLIAELRRLEAAMEHGVARHQPFKLEALKRLISYLLGTDKPRPERLDRLALLMGFQDWDSLRRALRGTDDGEGNYEPGRHTSPKA